MTVLGFRVVEEGRLNCGQTPHAAWAGASGERTRKAHAKARLEELRMHIAHPMLEPHGRSRVDRIARYLLEDAPLPSLPTLPPLPPHPPAKYSWQMASGDADANGPICMDCE